MAKYLVPKGLLKEALTTKYCAESDVLNARSKDYTNRPITTHKSWLSTAALNFSNVP